MVSEPVDVRRRVFPAIRRSYIAHVADDVLVQQIICISNVEKKLQEVDGSATRHEIENSSPGELKQMQPRTAILETDLLTSVILPKMSIIDLVSPG